MVIQNTKQDKLSLKKKFAINDTSYSSFWLYNTKRDIESDDFKDKFVNFYDEKELLSEFNPSVAKNIISYWSDPKDKILDPFSGRTRALVSYAMDRSYCGFDVSSDVIEYNYQRFNELGILKKDDFNIELIHADSLEVTDYFVRDAFDLIFTCPPYWNLEKYESVPGQLSDCKDYFDFLKQLGARLRNSIYPLKIGKYICIVVGDFRKDGIFYQFHSDLIHMMAFDKRIVLHDIVAIQNIPFHTAAYYFGSKRERKYTAKAHEYLLVWKKVFDDDVLYK